MICQRLRCFYFAIKVRGFPLVMLNALSSGLPVIAFDCPTGPGSIIKTGQNGKLVPNGDVDALSDAIQNFIAMGSSVREYAPKCVESTRSYHIDVVMKDWLKLLEI